MSRSVADLPRRPPKGALLDVIRDVDLLMSDRRKKETLASSISSYRLEVSFLEQQLNKTVTELAELNEMISKREEIAKRPVDDLLNLRAARETFKREYQRFKEIEQKARLTVMECNKEKISSLTEKNQLLQLRLKTVRNGKASVEARRKDLDVRKEQSRKELVAIFRQFNNINARVANELEDNQGKVKSLEDKWHNLKTELQSLEEQEKQAIGAHTVSLEELEQQQRLVAKFKEKNEYFEGIKAKADKLNEPVEHVRLEEQRFAATVKENFLKTLAGIIAEVKGGNDSLTGGINEYQQVMGDFENTLE